MSDENGGVKIPGWAWKVGMPALGAFQVLFGILFTMGISELKGLRTEVTTLNVQMGYAIKMDDKIEGLRERVNSLDGRVSRIEATQP